MDSSETFPLNLIYVEKWSTSEGGPVSSVSSILKIIGKEITVVSSNFTLKNGEVENLPKNIKHKTFLEFIFSNFAVKFFRKRKKSYIFINCLWDLNGIILFLLSSIFEKKIIIHTRGMLLKEALRKSSFAKFFIIYLIYKPMQSKINQIICSSEYEELSVKKVLPKIKTTIMPNYQYLPELKKVRNSKKNYSKKRLLYLSRITPKKGILELLEAWEKSNLKNWELLIYGPIENSIKKSFYKKINLLENKNVYYKGFACLDKKYKIYTSCNAFILPSHHENFGNVILEALHSGLIVITTNKTPWSKIKENGCGLIINPSTNSIITALKWLENLNQISLEEMSGRAIITASDFDVYKVRREILNIFK